ncbi:hypothetical protein F2981_21710 (plasmid) [Sinorhizobium meliloti]|nr:hypothetical protein [Sinorhizobium meliloti]
MPREWRKSGWSLRLLCFPKGRHGMVHSQVCRRSESQIKTVSDALSILSSFRTGRRSNGAIMERATGMGNDCRHHPALQSLQRGSGRIHSGDTGSAAGLDASIAKAYERKAGWLGAYWAPTALLAKYPMVRLQADVSGRRRRVEAVHFCSGLP